MFKSPTLLLDAQKMGLKCHAAEHDQYPDQFPPLKHQTQQKYQLVHISLGV